MMLSLDDDLEKIKELEKTIKENNIYFEKIKEHLNKYESDINHLKLKLADIEEISKVSLTLLLVSYNYNNSLNYIIFSIISGFLIYKSMVSCT